MRKFNTLRARKFGRIVRTACWICAICWLLGGCVSDPCAHGHEYGDWTTYDSTCAVQGTRERGCVRCGHRETEQLALSAHDYRITTHAPTCEDAGYAEYVCIVCGDSRIDDCTDALGHADRLYIESPSCLDAGRRYFRCERCDRIAGEETLAPEGHRFERGACATCGALQTPQLQLRACADGYEVYGLSDAVADTVYIPDIYKGLPVVAIADRAFERATFSDAVLPTTLKRIGAYAFARCARLQSIVIPARVTTIGPCALLECSGLTDLQVPFIGSSADAQDGFLAYLFGASDLVDIKDSIFPSRLTRVTVSGDSASSAYIGKNAFYGLKCESVRLGVGIAEVRQGAFSACEIDEIRITDASLVCEDHIVNTPYQPIFVCTFDPNNGAWGEKWNFNLLLGAEVFVRIELSRALRLISAFWSVRLL